MQLVANLLFLLFLLLLPAPAFTTDVSNEYPAAVCQKTYPPGKEALAGCLVKTAGLGSQPSSSDRDIYVEIFSQATEVEAARHISLPSSLEKALLVLIESCQSATDLDACLLESLDNERAQLSRYLDTLEPAWWWDDDVRFALFHIMLKTAEGKSRCESLEPSSQSACLEQVPMIMSRATEEALRDLSDTRTYRASYHATLRNLEVDRRIEAQREQDKEPTRIEAAARRLEGFPLRGGATASTLYAGQYQPIFPPTFYEPFPAFPSRMLPPVTMAPSPRNPSPQSVWCTARTVGGSVYTDCY